MRPRELLALRLPRNIDQSVYGYETDVPVFSSGAEARAHGLQEIQRPSIKAGKMIAGLVRKRKRAKSPRTAVHRAD